MLYLHYRTKKYLQQCVGTALQYTETSVFGAEYKPTGTFVGTNEKRSYFARVTMKNDVIVEVT